MVRVWVNIFHPTDPIRRCYPEPYCRRGPEYVLEKEKVLYTTIPVNDYKCTLYRPTNAPPAFSIPIQHSIAHNPNYQRLTPPADYRSYFGSGSGSAAAAKLCPACAELSATAVP